MMLRQARKGESPRPGALLFKPQHQTIASISQTLERQLDLDAVDAHQSASPSGSREASSLDHRDPAQRQD